MTETIPVNMVVVFVIATAASHQEAIKMFWLHFSVNGLHMLGTMSEENIKIDLFRNEVIA